MAAVFFLKLLSDIAAYMTIAAMIAGSIGVISDRLFLSVLIVCVSASAGCALRERGRSGWLRFLPLLGLLLIIPASTGLWDAVLMIPPAAYAAYIVGARLFGMDGYNRAMDSFLFLIKALPMALCIATLICGYDKLSHYALPYLIIYLVSAVLSLRCLRHEAETVKQPRFQMMNAASVALICLVALVLFSEGFRSAVWQAIKLVYDFIVSLMMTGISYIITGIAWVFFKILPSAVEPEPEGEADQTQIGPGEELAQKLEDLPEEGIGRELLLWIGTILALALIALGLYVLFIKLSSNRRRGVSGGKLTRQSLPDGEQGGSTERLPRLLSRSEEHRVRYYYRKGLLFSRAKGANLNGCLDSAELTHRQAIALSDATGKSEALRRLYLPARYGNGSQKGDGEKARALFRSLKRAE